MKTNTQIHFVNFTRRLSINTIFFLVPLYFLQLGYNGWQIGVITSLFAVAPLLSSFPIGWMNDRFSIKRMVHGALLLLVFLFLIMCRAKNFIVMATVFLLLGTANNALEISMNSVYYKDETNEDPNKKYGVLSFWICLGSAIGVLSGGILLYYANFKVLFISYAFFLFMVLMAVYNLPEGKFQLISINEYKLELLNRKTVLFSVLIFILTLHWGAEQTVYSPFLKEIFHLNNFSLALYISLPLFVLALASLSFVFIKFNNRLNKKIFLFAMFLSGIGHALMVFGNVYFSFFFRVIHEIGDGLLAVLVFIFISRLFEKKSIGGSSGLLMAVMTLGHMVGALVFSPIGHNIGLQYPFILSGLLLIANTLFGWYIFMKNPY